MRLRRRSMVYGLLLLGLSAFAFATRVVPVYSTVFPEPGEVRLLGTDPYYHYRHTRFAVRHFPHLQRWDVGSRYPNGQWAEMPSIFDLGMAAVVLIASGPDASNEQVLTVMAWTPPVLSVLVLISLFGLVRWVADPKAGLLACTLLCAYPGTFLSRSLLGFADHHVLEVLLLLLSAWGAAACLVPAGRGRPRSWSRTALCALPAAALAFAWHGAPLYLAVLGATLLVVTLFELARGCAGSDVGTKFSRFGWGLLVWLTAAALIWPDLIMIPKVFPGILVASAVMGIGPWIVVKLAQASGRRGWSPGWVAMVAVAVTGLAVLTAIEALERSSWSYGLPWRTRSSLVSEHRELTWVTYWGNLGTPGILALASPVLAGFVRLADRQRRGMLVTSLMGTSLILLSWRAGDYSYVLPPFTAAMAALAFWVAAERWVNPPSRRPYAYIIAAVVAVLPVWPLHTHPGPQDIRRRAETMALVNDGWADAMRWMAEETPAPSLEVGAHVESWRGDFHYPNGSYGVMVAWDKGNFVAALGERVPVASQGVSTEAAHWLLSTSEDESARFPEFEFQEGEEIRYVVLDATTLAEHFVATVRTAGRNPGELVVEGAPGSPPVYGLEYERSMAARLYVEGGMGLGRFRLVYQSPHRSVLFYRASMTGQSTQWSMRLQSAPLETAEDRTRFEQAAERVVRAGSYYLYGARELPTVRIFEVVEGAILGGHAIPNSVVYAEVQLRSGSDAAEVLYVSSIRVGENGRFDLRVPYSTQGEIDGDVAALGPYHVYSGNPHPDGGEPEDSESPGDTDERNGVQVHVSEAQIQSGTVVELGELSDG